MMPWIPLLAVYVLSFAWLMAALNIPRLHGQYLAAKLSTSVLFLVTAVVCAVAGGHTDRLLYMLPALSLCFGGDLLLGLFHRSGNRTTGLFIGGVGAFTVAHLFFVGGMQMIQPLSWVDFIIPVLMVAATFGITRMKGMHVGKLTAVVCAYSFFVLLLSSQSTHLALTAGGTQWWLMSIGAGLFALSDIILLVLYFYDKKHPAVHIANLTTYFAGVFLIAVSLLYGV